MPRIVFFIKSVNNPGGTERVLSVVSSQFAAKGFDVDIISITGKGNSPFFQFDDRITFHYLFTDDKAVSPYREIRRGVLMKRIFRRISPDLLVMVGSNQGLSALIANKGIKTVTWEHFNIIMNCSARKRFLHRLAVRSSDAIVTLTERDAMEYRLRYGARNARCIPNPVTLDVSGRMDFGTDRKIMLNPARIIRQKRQDLLLRAWALSKGPALGWTLQIVGNGKPRMVDSMRSLSDKLGITDSVEICRPDKNIADRYNMAGVVVLSSEYEGLPLVLIEAQAMGVPQLSFDCATGPSEIIVNGKTGLLEEALDIQALAKGMDEMMTDGNLRLRMSDESLKNAGKFSIDNITQQWIDLFCKTTGSN